MDELEKKARRKEYDKKYQQSEKGKKSHTINNWKFNGLIGDYDAIYDRYIASTHCELCKQPYKNSKDKCMDHCHITGEFRNICCNSCNLNLPKQGKDITYDKNRSTFIPKKFRVLKLIRLLFNIPLIRSFYARFFRMLMPLMKTK